MPLLHPKLQRLRSLLIVLILVGAALLRLRHISQPFNDAFSWRQADTAMIARNFFHKSWNIFYPEVDWDGPEPGYLGAEFQTVSYIAALLYVVLGQADWVGRSVSVVFGLWGIFALYQLVRRTWDEERALASAAVMAVLPGSIFIERSFLPDPAMVALVTTSLWMFVMYLQTQQRGYLILATVTGVWGFLTKIPGLIIGLPMAYAMLEILRRKQLLQSRNLALLGLVGFVGLVPVSGYYLWARHLSFAYPPFHFAGSGNWLWDGGLKNWWAQGYFLPHLGQHFNVWIWTPPMMVIVLLGFILRPPKDGCNRAAVDENVRSIFSDKAPWLFHWWLLAGVVYYLIGAKELVDNPWNFHIINPAAAALAGHGVISIASTKNLPALSRPFFATILSLILILGGFGQDALRWMYKPYADESYKLGLAFRHMTEPDDLIVTMANTVGDPVALYYSHRKGWVFPPANAWDGLPVHDDRAVELLDGLRVKGAGWLGIVQERRQELLSSHPRFVQYLTRISTFRLETPEYVIYRFLAPEQPAGFVNPI